MPTLLLLFVVLPAVELALLIEVGSRIGTAATLALIVATGMLGAALARRQGLAVLRRLQRESAAGRFPADPLVDGVLVLLAAALLVTPGVLTDAFGFACLVPAFRSLVKRALRRRLERAVREGRVAVHVAGMPGAEPWSAGPREEKEVWEVGRDPEAGPRRPPTLH
ncbi:MAG: FxsA family protein [Myxococcota bacterium]|nr:FxsA family protein [Myxococcota bacterium]